MTKVILNVLRFFGADIKKYAKENLSLYDGEDVRMAIQNSVTHKDKIMEKISFEPCEQELILLALHNPEYVTN